MRAVPTSSRPSLPWRFALFAAAILGTARTLLILRSPDLVGLGEVRARVGVLYDLFAFALLVLLRLFVGALPGRALRVFGALLLGLPALVLVLSNVIYSGFFHAPLEPYVLDKAGDLWLVRGSVAELAKGPELFGLLLIPLSLLLWSCVQETRSRLPLSDPRLASPALAVLILGAGCNWAANVQRRDPLSAPPHLLRSNVVLRWAFSPFRKAHGADATRMPLDEKWVLPEAVLRDVPLEPGTTSLGVPGYPLARHRVPADREARLLANGVHVDALGKLGDRPNIVFVLLESVRASELGAWGLPDSPTPTLDALAKDGLSVERFYAASHASIRGSFASQCGAYPNPHGEEYVTGAPTLRVSCWQEALRQKGYSTHWFTGHFAPYDGEGPFNLAHGVQTIVDLSAYPKDAPRADWGVVDHVLYGRVVEELSKAKEPFSATVTTVASHHPHKLPKGLPGVRTFGFSGMYEDYLESLAYVDFSIGQLLEAARKEPWFVNTVFIFTGDHGSWAFPEGEDAARRGGALSRAMVNETYFRLPLVMYGPKLLGPKRLERVASQVDLFPTLLDLTNTEADGAFVGTSLFAEGPRPPLLIGGVGDVHAVQGDVRCWWANTTPSCVKLKSTSFYGDVGEEPVAAPELAAWAVRVAGVTQLLGRSDHLLPPPSIAEK